MMRHRPPTKGSSAPAPTKAMGGFQPADPNAAAAQAQADQQAAQQRLMAELQRVRQEQEVAKASGGAMAPPERGGVRGRPLDVTGPAATKAQIAPGARKKPTPGPKKMPPGAPKPPQLPRKPKPGAGGDMRFWL